MSDNSFTFGDIDKIKIKPMKGNKREYETGDPWDSKYSNGVRGFPTKMDMKEYYGEILDENEWGKTWGKGETVYQEVRWLANQHPRYSEKWPGDEIVEVKIDRGDTDQGGRWALKSSCFWCRTKEGEWIDFSKNKSIDNISV